MSPLLKLRALKWPVLMPLCGVLIWSAPAPAQDQTVQDQTVQDQTAPMAAAGDNAAFQYPAPAPSPEAAGEKFYQFLANGVLTDNKSSRATFDLSRAGLYLGSVSRAQMFAVTSRPQSGNLERLFALLARQKDEPQFEGKVVGKEGDQTLVEVASAPGKKRAVVVAPEDGGFRVDVKATLGRWSNLSGDALDLAWADYTGIIAPTLANNPAFQRARENARRASCQSNLKQVMLGILQYAQDYNQSYPSARKWVDEIFPYVKAQQIFNCPALPEGANYGYAFNQNLDKTNLSALGNPAQTVAIYETDALERNAFGGGEERAYRHLGGSNLAFADGHIKWFAKGEEPAGAVRFAP